MKGRATAVLLAVLLAVGVGAGAVWALADRSGGEPGGTKPESSSAPATELPGLTPATGDPVPDGLTSAKPGPGKVVQVAGPFDDRFDYTRLTLTEGELRGGLTITSDVSDLLELQVVAGFYDAQGRYLGLGRHTHHLGEGHAHAGPPEQHEDFTIPVPERFRGEAVSAAVAVPVLVNE